MVRPNFPDTPPPFVSPGVFLGPENTFTVPVRSTPPPFLNIVVFTLVPELLERAFLPAGFRDFLLPADEEGEFDGASWRIEERSDERSERKLC